ncbi:MAG: PfkB family carbohydrate kinase, partial [Saprospiraceae bacterium]
MQIVTLTLHPALDKSTTTPYIAPDHKLRCTVPQIDAGGGGINVSKGIHRLGGQSTAVFPIGGHTGRLLRDLVEQAGIATQTLEVPGETRESLSVTESGNNSQYRFTMAGAGMTEAQADQCLDLVAALQPEWLVVGGSLPAGLPENYLEKVADRSKKMGAKLV